MGTNTPTSDEARKFLDAVKGERLEAVFTVGLALGLRRGEVLGPRWSDLDFVARTIRVGQALQRSGGIRIDGQPSKLRFVEPKSLRSSRTIPMPECVVNALRAHRAMQAQERLLAGSEWQDLGLVFTTGKGTPLEPRGIVTSFKRMLKKAGLSDTIRLHDSRHFTASLLLELGVHPRTVMEILGHSDISLTMNTYSHVVPTLMRQAMDKVDVALGGR
ncbi:MAG: site-specific integrase [Candidatus Binataceae bacterium]